MQTIAEAHDVAHEVVGKISVGLTNESDQFEGGYIWIGIHSMGNRSVWLLDPAEEAVVVGEGFRMWEGYRIGNVLEVTWTSGGSGARIRAFLGKDNAMVRYEENGKPSNYGDLFYRLTGAHQGREDFERRKTVMRQREELRYLLQNLHSQAVAIEQQLDATSAAVTAVVQEEPLAEWEKELLGADEAEKAESE